MRVLLALVALFSAVVQAHNELLYPRDKVCYYEELRSGDKFGVTFQVGTRDPSSSEQLDVDFYIQGPRGNRMLELSRVTDGTPELFINDQGKYLYCFSNEYSSVGTKDVTFHLNTVKASEAREEHPDSLEGQVKLLSRIIQDVQHEQSYIVIRERVHRNTAESTNDRVKWWSLFQLGVVVANTVFQVLFLKRFFEVKSNV